MSQCIDHHVSAALAHLIGADWQTRLRSAVATAIAGETLPPQRHWTPGEWTAERETLLRELHGTLPAWRVLDRINALDGKPISSVAALRMKVKKMGLHTPDLPPMPEGFTGEWTTQALATHAQRAARLRVMNGGGEWTDARLALLRANILHPSRDELLGMVNALPGSPIASVESMMFKSRAIGLRRPVGLLPKVIVARPPPAPVPPAAADCRPIPAAPAPTIKPDLNVAPAPEPPRQIVPDLDDWTADGELTPEAEHDALEQFAKGWDEEMLHEDFGGNLGWWRKWCERQAGSAA